ncbi:pentatricopeptide repeat-containing protein At2g13600-like [Diospyros lotus]|uniref:pentatricopeptide repeat-containing protein At2g13600-like n=1 Tax=Diospyros lotus TaxID=55363 RepID=UPI0022598D1D|nr:pentatricopeptide repeat-containing protein At2g13600-like [Diospyros lotus]XP_052195968.1 pentatricopeptide repeat-containing protein At2g13600-like [Diospyros lotus]XP_052195969.1 pentatricopeptide repeat-containing protein At2g13600-like [Diospyros lotus]
MLKNHICLRKEIRGRICRKRYFSNVAYHMFDEIPRGVYAREAAKQHMDSLGKKPTKYTFCSALNSCAKTSNWYLGLQIHAQVIQTGHEENLFISSALVDVYAKCGELADAWRVFDSMKMHDQVSWTSIIAGYSQNGDGRQAILLFKEMLLSQIRPNAVTYVGVISACIGLELAFECCISLHAHVVKLGTDRNSFVVSSLIDCYSKCGRVEQAVLLFDARAEKDIVLLNSMISGYSQNLFGEEALKLFIQMQKYSISPTDHTLTSILNACGCLAVLQQGRQFHALVIKMGSTCNVFVACSLIDMYSKCGSIDEARCVFDQAVKKNSVLWTSMISGYTQCGRGSCGLELFDYLVTKEGLMPDHVCLTAVLSACNHAGFLDRGIDYFNRMRRDYGLIPDLDQYACVIDLYARQGHLKKAKGLMEEMPFRPNSVIWSSFLHSCKVYGEIELGKQAALQLFKMEPQNAVPYITLASIYAGAGLWSEVAKTRKLLNLKEMKKNTGWSWVEIGKEVHLFSVGDISHPQSPEIYVELEKLNSEMREVGCILERGENVDTECLLEEKRNLEQFYQ